MIGDSKMSGQLKPRRNIFVPGSNGKVWIHGTWPEATSSWGPDRVAWVDLLVKDAPVRYWAAVEVRVVRL